MKKNVVGIVVLVVGIILLALGLNELGTFGSRAGRMLGAGLSNKVLSLLVADLLDAFRQKENRRAVQEGVGGLSDGQRGDRLRLGATFGGASWNQGGAFHVRCFVSEESHL